MNTTLECNTCTATSIGVQSAIAHVQEYPDHVMNGQDDDGTKTRVYNHDRYPHDGYDDNPDTGCSTCDGGGCGDCR